MKMDSSSPDNRNGMRRFERSRHIKYFAHHLRELPSFYDKLDTNRLTLVHFAVHALDMLGVWDDDDPTLMEQLRLNKEAIIDWIYSLQVVVGDDNTDDNDKNGSDTAAPVRAPAVGGFVGGTFLGRKFWKEDADETTTYAESRRATTESIEYIHGHIAMTYTAMCTLLVLGDDFSKLDRAGILRSLRALQRDIDGSFQCVVVGSEHDIRFIYCACSICYLLNDWSPIDIPRVTQYIKNCRAYDGAISLIPGQEGHGGSTFCGIASLLLMGQLDPVLAEDNWRNELIYWCVHRQVGGMQGRPNKYEDTCYSYWIGGTLRLLRQDHLLDHVALRRFVLNLQGISGGFQKQRDAFPDMLHSFYSLAYLSFSSRHFDNDTDNNQNSNENNGNKSNNDIQLKQFNCTLGICTERLQNHPFLVQHTIDLP